MATATTKGAPTQQANGSAQMTGAIETKVVLNKLFMNKLVERGALVQKDVEQWMKDVQARFR
jgi:hypothetical protein